MRRRILAIEDGCFTVGRHFLSEALLIGVVMDGFLLEKLFIDTVKVDGLDATDKALTFVSKAGLLDLILLHGVPYAGFNLIDACRLYEETSYPVLCILDRKPDIQRVKKALRMRFLDWQERLRILEKTTPVELSLGCVKLIVAVQGLTLDEAAKLLRETTLLGKMPEPLRVAKIIAKGLPPLLLS
ncbi:MAG: DUF99 family protein [Candidatus Bathyarchaeia archaeon]